MSAITEFTNASNIKIIEDLLKNKCFLDELISYVEKMMSNSQCEYDIELGEMEDDIKNVYIGEIKNVIKKLTIIMCKYFDKKPGTLISLELDNIWYQTEKCILPNNTNVIKELNPYAQNKTISKILTIICKLIDFLNEYHLNQISFIDKKIDYLRKKLEEKEQMVSVMQYTVILEHYNEIIEQIKLVKVKYIKNFKDTHQISQPILHYFITIINSDFVNTSYLQFTPITMLNIFQSSLYFLTEDNDFLNFIVKFKNWLPSEYRCKYGVELIKLLNDDNLDFRNKQIIKLFQPNPALLIDDVISMYWKCISDSSLIADIPTLHFMLAHYKEKINWSTLNYEKIILFVSIELSLISKFNKSEMNNDKIHEYVLNILLQIIEYALVCNQHLFDSYLVYSIPNKLVSLYDEEYLDNGINVHLDNIFRMYLSSKLGIYYLASMIELSQITKLPVNLEQNTKFTKWFNYYKYINENIADTDIIDPLTSTVLVIPYLIPMDNNFTISNICDKNIIESYLWEKNENPFTRSELTIEKLEEFNTGEKNILLIKETKRKLNQIITDAKKSID
jgi:hypothetical protein